MVATEAFVFDYIEDVGLLGWFFQQCLLICLSKTHKLAVDVRI